MFIRSHYSANYSDYKFETSKQKILDSLPEGKSYKEFKNDSRSSKETKDSDIRSSTGGDKQ